MHLLILHIARVFGGAERTTSNLLRGLNRDVVHHITLAAPAALQDLMPADFDAFIDIDPIVKHGWYHTPRSLYEDVRACAHMIREVAPDLALGMMHYSAALTAMGVRLERLPVKVIASYRGPIFEYIRRYERGFRRRSFLHTAVGVTAHLADRIIVPSEGTARELTRRFLGPSHRTVVIPNGIDAERVAKAATADAPGIERLAPDLPLLCVAARLSPEKDLGLLLTAFRMLQDRCPAALIVLGDGPDRTFLESQVDDWGLQNRVVFVGHRDNVYPYMRRADLYVHTCQFEGFGYTMLEAMACGTAVIATDCPYGPREVVGNDEFGLLVPAGDAAGLAAAMAHLLLDYERRRSLARSGLERAAELSIKRMTDRYEDVFADVV